MGWGNLISCPIYLMLSNLSALSNQIYSLKMRYGKRVILENVTYTTNVETGVQSIATSSVKHIKYGIIETPKHNSIAEYSRLFLNSDRGFSKEGFFEPLDTILIIDKKDLGTFQIQISTVVIYNSLRYDVKEFYDQEASYLLKIRALKNQTKLIYLNFNNSLTFNSEATHGS